MSSNFSALKKNRKAFTLIEVILALIVMSSGLFILTNAWSGTYSRLRKTQIQVQLAALLERKVTEIEREYKNKSLESIEDEKEDKFGGEVPETYSWKMTSKKLEIPDISASLRQDGEGDPAMIGMMQTFTQHLSKSIKEVKISVINTELGKPLTVDVTIYMIDYDKPLPIPGAGGAAEGGGG